MEKIVEQRYAAYGDDALSRIKDFEWHKIKTMLIVFFTDVVLFKRTLCLLELLAHLRNRVTNVRSTITKDRKLHHDNAACYGAIVVRQLLAKLGEATMPNPPPTVQTWPGLAFSCFRMKRELKGHWFNSIDVVQEVTTKYNSIPEIKFQRAFDE
ncbi:hypothetical protein J6590_040849 [Homalodisca vitripennis]|nr:hypothetical protein J6590_040849 [Homalodisca vitripennis]